MIGGTYPISRWCWRPAAGWLAARLSPTPIRPVHLTVCGLLAAAGAVGVLAARPAAAPWAAGLVLLAWFFDRADGLLARRQGSVTAWGAWLDANVDELADLALQVSLAWAAARQGAALAWPLAIAFLLGKYLLMYGLHAEEANASCPPDDCRTGGDRPPVFGSTTRSVRDPQHATGRRTAPGASRPPHAEREGPRPRVSPLRRLWHLPGNADVRVHLTIAALLSGWFTTELAAVAIYYNLRWIARYALVARRLGGRP